MKTKKTKTKKTEKYLTKYTNIRLLSIWLLGKKSRVI